MHACSSPHCVEFEGWEMQFEAAESRTEGEDVYLRGETFMLFKHRMIQAWFVALSQELSSRGQASGWWVLKGAAQRFLSAQGVQRTSPAGTHLWYLSGKCWERRRDFGGVCSGAVGASTDNGQIMSSSMSLSHQTQSARKCRSCQP